MGIKESAIRQFGKQAEAYSKGNIFVDGIHLSRIVKRSGVAKNHHVLDIATGAGFLALEFAKNADLVIGTDLTRNMLLHAMEKQKQKNSGFENTGFLLSDVESLPFPDCSFDIVSCRFAFHHFPDPFDEWVRRAGTSEKDAEVIKKLMIQDIENDSTGLRIKIRDGRLGFTYDTIILIMDISS